MMKALLGSILLIISISAFAKTPTMKLDCAKIPNYKTEAERQYLSKASGGGDIYNINVTFINKRPDDKLLDKTLRECLAVAIKLDGKKDILASPWFRPIQGANPNDDENLNPYGILEYISYTASTKSIGVHSIELKKK
jgi:hypothetical protein